MALKEELEGDSTEPQDIWTKLTEGKTAGVPNLVLFLILVVGLVLFIKHRQASSNSGNIAGANTFSLPYIGGYPITTVVQGPPGQKGPPGKQGPPGKPGKPGGLRHKKPPTGKHKPPKKKSPIPKGGGGGGGPVHRHPAPTHAGAHITAPHTPAQRKVTVSAVAPSVVKSGGTAQRHTAKKAAPVHSRTPDRKIAKPGAHR